VVGGVRQVEASATHAMGWLYTFSILAKRLSGIIQWDAVGMVVGVGFVLAC